MEFNSKRLFQSSGEEKESRCLRSRPRQNVKLGVVVVQRQQRNVQKSVMCVQSCCLANLYLSRFAVLVTVAVVVAAPL